MQPVGTSIRRIIPLTLAALLVTAAPAAAQATSSVTPNRAGKPATLRFNIDGVPSPLSARLPRDLRIAVPRGFTTDLRALSKRCSTGAAKLNECPRGSLMGSGSIVVEVTPPASQNRPPYDTTIPLNVYLGRRNEVLALAYLFGWQVVPGTLRTTSGIAVSFDGLPSGEAFEPLGFSFRLKSISLEFGASRVIRIRTVRRVNGTRRVRVARRHVHLIRNPSTCRGGSWNSSVVLTYGAGSPAEVRLPAPTACR